MPEPEPQPKRPVRRKVFAAVGLVAGLAMLGLEVLRPPEGTTSVEWWFWRVVAVLLVVLAVAELTSRPKQGL
jgi:hypothetical protein